MVRYHDRKVAPRAVNTGAEAKPLLGGFDMGEFTPFVDRAHTHGTKIAVRFGADRLVYSSSAVAVMRIRPGDFVEYLVDDVNCRLAFNFHQDMDAPSHAYRLCRVGGKRSLRSQVTALLSSNEWLEWCVGQSLPLQRQGELWVCECMPAVDVARHRMNDTERRRQFN